MTVIRLPWSRPPLTENQRLHWRPKATLTKQVRTAGFWLTRDKITPATHVTVGLTWVVGDNRRRDVDNIVPTLKALCDGIVDAGIVPDDTPQFMTKTMPTIRVEKGTEPYVELVITARSSCDCPVDHAESEVD